MSKELLDYLLIRLLGDVESYHKAQAPLFGDDEQRKMYSRLTKEEQDFIDDYWRRPLEGHEELIRLIESAYKKWPDQFLRDRGKEIPTRIKEQEAHYTRESALVDKIQRKGLEKPLVWDSGAKSVNDWEATLRDLPGPKYNDPMMQRPVLRGNVNE
jgi:hypothetical protein